MHEPPDLTRLSMRSGPLQGNPEWREAIECYSPLLVVSGHDHQTPSRMGFWHDRIGNTLCLNAGQGNETLNYFVIDTSLQGPAASLPTSMFITHLPTKEVQLIPERKQ
ncbi:MAG: metallophosphoesterase [Blastocatellia bacterium]|nr:metallophosphoesterase [Blastocatellia bacterium]